MPKKMKIGPKIVDCIFIGFTHNSSAYQFLVHESKNPDVHKNMIIESRNASFFEHVFPCKTKEDKPSSSRQIFETIDEDNSQNFENDEILETE